MIVWIENYLLENLIPRANGWRKVLWWQFLQQSRFRDFWSGFIYFSHKLFTFQLGLKALAVLNLGYTHTHTHRHIYVANLLVNIFISSFNLFLLLVIDLQQYDHNFITMFKYFYCSQLFHWFYFIFTFVQAAIRNFYSNLTE